MNKLNKGAMMKILIAITFLLLVSCNKKSWWERYIEVTCEKTVECSKLYGQYKMMRKMGYTASKCKKMQMAAIPPKWLKKKTSKKLDKAADSCIDGIRSYKCKTATFNSNALKSCFTMGKLMLK